MATYSEKLRDPRWQRMRLRVMGRDNFSCRLCGDSASTLNVHHLYYTKGAAPWEYPTSSLATICEDCHGTLHECNPGGQILESLIAGGASLTNILGFTEVIGTCFSDGPNPSRFTQQQWDRLHIGLESLLWAVASGQSNEVAGDSLTKDLTLFAEPPERP